MSTAATDRRRYELVIEKYLRDCFRHRTAARVSELADMLDAARPYLSKVIQQVFGMPLRAVLRKRQLDEARRLLRVTDLPLDDVAAASAFGDRTTFFRVFRNSEGMTPNQYRQRRQRSEK